MAGRVSQSMTLCCSLSSLQVPKLCIFCHSRFSQKQRPQLFSGSVADPNSKGMAASLLLSEAAKIYSLFSRTYTVVCNPKLYMYLYIHANTHTHVNRFDSRQPWRSCHMAEPTSNSLACNLQAEQSGRESEHQMTESG